jgi:hypothetical protein
MRSHPRGETSAGAIQMPLGPSRCSSDGLAQPAARLAGIHLPSNQLAAAGVVAAAFALLPDIDEPGSTVSRKLGTMSLPSPRSRTDWPAGIIKRPTASCSPPLSQEPCSVGPVPALTCMLSAWMMGAVACPARSRIGGMASRDSHVDDRPGLVHRLASPAMAASRYRGRHPPPFRRRRSHHRMRPVPPAAGPDLFLDDDGFSP